MIEEKLRNVKEKLIERLSRGELEEGQYRQTVYQLLLDEGIVKGPYENSTTEITVKLATEKEYTTEITVKLANRLMPKLPAKEHWGLEKSYVALEGKGLSEEAQEDLRKYSELKRSTNDYLKAELGNRPILRSEFERKVEDHLMSQTNLSSISSEIIQREAVIRITSSLKRKFKIQEDPEKTGNYDIKSLESVVDNL